MKHQYSAEERRNLLLAMLHEKNKVNINELVKTFGVTDVSIRKDLAVLEERQLLVRVKGGAINIHQFNESDDLPINHKQAIRSKEKRLIGKLAATLINDNETIIIDSGSTTMEVARNLDRNKTLTVITNALDIALSLYNCEKFTVIVLGGTMRSVSHSTVGMIAEYALKNFFCDKLFLGIDSFSTKNGLSTPNIEEASLNQAMIESAKEVIAVFDSSKFGKRSFAHIASLDKIDTIVTDSGLPDDIKEFIQSRGIRLHVVDVD